MTQESVTTTVQVRNRQGIHARPAHAIATLATGFQARIEIVRDGTIADGKSILAVLTLAAERGTVLTIRASGQDAKAAVHALEKLIVSGFGEDDDKNFDAGHHSTD